MCACGSSVALQANGDEVKKASTSIFGLCFKMQLLLFYFDFQLKFAFMKA